MTKKQQRPQEWDWGHPRVGDWKLDVISQWDYNSKFTVYQDIKTALTGKIRVYFILEKCIAISDDGKIAKWKAINKPSEDIKKQLTDRGYTLRKDLTAEAEKL